jgi:hypothetical protein
MVFRLLQELEDTPDRLQPRVLPNDKGVISPEFYWSVYTLDRRWSFGTGLPFAVQDSDVRYRPSLKVRLPFLSPSTWIWDRKVTLMGHLGQFPLLCLPEVDGGVLRNLVRGPEIDP